MSVVLTIRNVPEQLRDALAADARVRGQSLQAYLLETLERRAAFRRNRQILADIEADLAGGGGVGAESS